MPWDPLQDLLAWQERIERLAAPHSDSWAPPIDVYETVDRYIIAAELPGLTRDQIDLVVEDSRVVLRGQRSERTSDREEPIHFHQIERGYGPFSRTFEFAEKIDGNAISADLRDGVLTVVLPKAPPAPSRKIEVR